MVYAYNKYQALEQYLRNQLIDAIAFTYLESLQNSDTDVIKDTIPEVITIL